MTPAPSSGLALPVVDPVLEQRLADRLAVIETLLAGHCQSRTAYVSQAAAHLMLNVWPTLTNAWGGEAKPGTVYMLVDSVTFEPF